MKQKKGFTESLLPFEKQNEQIDGNDNQAVHQLAHPYAGEFIVAVLLVLMIALMLLLKPLNTQRDSKPGNTKSQQREIHAPVAP